MTMQDKTNRKKNYIKKSALIVAVTSAFLMTGCQSDASDAETEALQKQIAQLEQQIATLEQQVAADMASKETPSAAVDTQEQSGTVPDGSIQPTADGDGEQAQTDTNIGKDQTAAAGDSAQLKTDTSAGYSQQPDSNSGNNTQIQPDTNVGGNHNPGHDEELYHNPSPSVGNGNTSNQQDTSAAGLTTYTIEELSSMVDAFVEKANAASPGGTASQNIEQFFALKQEEKQIDDLLDRHEDELEYLYKNQSLSRDDYKRLERELERLEDKLDDAEDQLEYVFGIDD